jgi:hypothetical protein
MQRDHELALYALGLSAVVLIGAGVVTGIGSGGLTTDAPSVESHADGTVDDQNLHNTSQMSEVGSDSEANDVTVHDGEAYDVTIDGDGNGTVVLRQMGTNCGGGVGGGTQNTTETDHNVDNTTVTLVVEDGDETVDAFGRRQLVELLWTTVSDHAELDRYDHVEVRADVYYESHDREQPLDVAGITVRPVNRCLPTVQGEVDLDSEAVTVDNVLPPLDNVELQVTDSLGVLSIDDRETIEKRLVANGRTSYRIQQQFDNPTRLNATVLEATNQNRVDIELTAPGTDGRAVVVTVDLDSGRIVQSWSRYQLESSNVTLVGTNTSAASVTGSTTLTANETITFETNSTDAAP